MLLPRPTPTRPRRGTIVPLLLFALGACLAVFAFTVNKSWLWSLREDLKLAADATALAATQDLVNDDLLRGDANRYPALLEDAEGVAIAYAAGNPVRGRPLTLVSNPANHRTGDIAFGVLSLPRAGDFITVPP